MSARVAVSVIPGCAEPVVPWHFFKGDTSIHIRPFIYRELLLSSSPFLEGAHFAGWNVGTVSGSRSQRPRLSHEVPVFTQSL